MDILETIAAETRQRYAERQKAKPLTEIRREAESLQKGGFAFERAIRGAGFAVICEIKKASPSRGIIDEKFDYLKKALEYERGGADCISCLTEPLHFLGSDKIFAEVRAAVKIPMLRKDFTVCEYQLYESALLGADAVLLIAALLNGGQLKEYINICNGLGLSAVCECRSADEIALAAKAGAKIIGVNNRNLRDFSVDTQKAFKLKKFAPEGALFISESGMDAKAARAAKLGGANACLIGEAMMRAPNPAALIKEIKDV